MENYTSNSLSLKAATYLFLLLLLTITIPHTTSTRILDEELPPPAPLVTPVAPASPNSIPPPVTAASPVASPTTGASVASVAAPTTEASSSAVTGGATTDHALSFFMHDILGGSNPTARVVTGIVSNSAANGQLPFARPNGAVLPINGGVPLNNGNNGIVNNNNIPFLTGLGGTTSAVNGNNVINGNGVNGGNLQAGTALQKLSFGAMTVIDDELTESHEIDSGVVGKAQGFYVASSEDGTSQTMAFTAMLKSGEYVDSISFFGVHRTVNSESHVGIMGGTGKYVNAKGYAVVQTVKPMNQQQETDGVETLLQFTVYLA